MNSSSSSCSTIDTQGKRIFVIAHDPNAAPYFPHHKCQSAAMIELEIDSVGHIVGVRSGNDVNGGVCPVVPLTFVNGFNCVDNFVGKFGFSYETHQIIPGLQICDIEVEDLGYCDCKDFEASLSCSYSQSASSTAASSTGPDPGPGL